MKARFFWNTNIKNEKAVWYTDLQYKGRFWAVDTHCFERLLITEGMYLAVPWKSEEQERKESKAGLWGLPDGIYPHGTLKQFASLGTQKVGKNNFLNIHVLDSVNGWKVGNLSL